jgi:hypothetical protein
MEYSIQSVLRKIRPGPDSRLKRGALERLGSTTGMFTLNRRARLMEMWSGHQKYQSCLFGPLENHKQTVFSERRRQPAQLVREHEPAVITLTPELRQEIQKAGEEPVRLVDPETHTQYVILSRQSETLA